MVLYWGRIKQGAVVLGLVRPLTNVLPTGILFRCTGAKWSRLAMREHYVGVQKLV